MSANLLTPQQHRFVFAIIEGKSQAEAYKAARFPTGNKPLKDISIKHAGQEAAKLMRQRPVAQALARAREAVAERAEITVLDLVQRLENVHDVALRCDPPQTSGAVASLMGIAKLLGLVIDRSQVAVVHHKPALSSQLLELSEEEWKRQFAPHGGHHLRNDSGSKP